MHFPCPVDQVSYQESINQSIKSINQFEKKTMRLLWMVLARVTTHQQWAESSLRRDVLDRSLDHAGVVDIISVLDDVDENAMRCDE
jgi:hypothetical protein